MRKRTAAGAAGVAGVAALGVWLLDFGLPGLPSVGVGENTALVPTDATAVTEVEEVDEPEVEPGTGAPGELEADESANAPLPAADVLVDGEGYLMATRWASDGKPIRERVSLAKVVETAKTAAGDSNGFRARIARTPDATAGAESDLLERLEAAGVPGDAIDRRTRLVEIDVE